MVLQHPPRDEDRVEVLVISPDTLVGHLPGPPGLAGRGWWVVTDDVDDPTGRVERLVDRLTGGPGAALRLLLSLTATTAASTPADCLPLKISERFACSLHPGDNILALFLYTASSSLILFCPGTLILHFPGDYNLIFGQGLYKHKLWTALNTQSRIYPLTGFNSVTNLKNKNQLCYNSAVNIFLQISRNLTAR